MFWLFTCLKPDVGKVESEERDEWPGAGWLENEEQVVGGKWRAVARRTGAADDLVQRVCHAGSCGEEEGSVVQQQVVFMRCVTSE